MIVGLSLSAFTAFHVVLSLVGIASGILVLLRPSASTKPTTMAGLFLATTLAASITGFLFPSARPGLGHVVGVVSLVALGLAVAALYHRRLAGPWRAVYVGGATVALYLNAFIGVMQAFGRIDYVRTLPSYAFVSPLLLAHLLLLALCVWLGLHAFASLQAAGSTPRPVRRRPVRPLRVVDRWGNY